MAYITTALLSGRFSQVTLDVFRASKIILWEATCTTQLRECDSLPETKIFVLSGLWSRFPSDTHMELPKEIPVSSIVWHEVVRANWSSGVCKSL